MAETHRVDLTEDEAKKYAATARFINGIRDQQLRSVYITTIIFENVNLLKQVNELRQQMGLEPLPAYVPKGI